MRYPRVHLLVRIMSHWRILVVHDDGEVLFISRISRKVIQQEFVERTFSNKVRYPLSKNKLVQSKNNIKLD